MIKHSQAVELLPWYVNGTLGESEREAVERHLQDCTDCRAEVAEWTILREAVEDDSSRIPSPREGVFDRVMDRIDAEAPRRELREKGRRGSFWGWMFHPAPAWVACGLLLAILGYQSYAPPTATAIPVSAKLSEARAGDQVTLAAGERFLHLEVYVYPDRSFDKYLCELKLGDRVVDTVEAPGGQEPLDLLFPARSLQAGDYILSIRGFNHDASAAPTEIRGIAFELKR